MEIDPEMEEFIKRTEEFNKNYDTSHGDIDRLFNDLMFENWLYHLGREDDGR